MKTKLTGLGVFRLETVCVLLVMEVLVLQALQDCPQYCTCANSELNCQGKGLQTLPNIQDKNMLLRADFSRNNFTFIRLEEIDGLYSRVLDLSQSNIRYFIPLPDDTLESFSVQVEDMLNISHNTLTSFPVELINMMPFVDVIDLSYNIITTLSAAIVVQNAHVERMILSHNRLVYVHPQAFIGPTGLNEIDLRYNYLTKFGPSFELTSNNLLLGGNPWLCDCHERWMLENRHITESPSPPVCSQPNHVTGRPVSTLQPDDFICSPRYNNGSLLVQSSLGGRVELICPAEGDPPISEVMWSFRGTHPSYTIASKPDKPLIIEAVTEATVGRYWCTVWNKGGNLTLSISLSVRRSDIPKKSLGITPSLEDQTTNTVLNSSQLPLPVASDFKVPIFGIFALTSLLFFMFFVVMALLAYTCNLRNRLKHKRSAARDGMFSWQTSFPNRGPYTNTERSTLPVGSGYMHLVRNVRHNRDASVYRQDDARCRSLMLHPSDYASTRKRVLPVVPPVAPTLDPQGMVYGYESEHLYDTLGARCFSSCSESSGSQISVAI